MNFNQIKVNSTTELMINKSKFIAKSFVVLSTVDVNNIIDSLKSEYRDATHICYDCQGFFCVISGQYCPTQPTHNDIQKINRYG